MKMKKVTAMLAALVMACGITGSAAAYYIDDPDYEDDTIRVAFGEDHTGYIEVLSKDEHFALKDSYNNVSLKSIGNFKSGFTKYLTIPDGYTDVYLANPWVLEGVYVSDSVRSLDIGQRYTSGNLTIIGNRNSYAEYYANKENYDFVLLGDTDNDGKIGAKDIVAQMQSLLGDMDYESEFLSMAADMNHDGVHNIPDLILTTKAILEGIGGSTHESGMLASPLFSRTLPPKPETDLVKAFSDYVADHSDDVLLNTPDETKSESEQKKCNKVYSPLSVYMAVSMLAECCDGESETELLKYLNVEDKEDLQKINHDIFDYLYFDKYDTYLKIGNSIWFDDTYLSEPFEICTEKTDTLAEKYFASSFVRDFASQNDCNEISEWISQNTSGKFKPEILADELDTERIKIINTITFKDGWTERFYDTRQGKFKTPDENIDCEFMYENNAGKLSLDDDFAVYTKQFKNGSKMSFVLPETGKTVSDILENKETMQKVLAASTSAGLDADVSAYIPKFSTKSNFGLVGTLEDAGVSKVFKDADIEPIVKNGSTFEEVAVSSIVHEAVIDVDDEGCEAAAYTMITIASTCPTTPPGRMKYEFRCDRPFIYYISDSSGVPFFMGIINDPTQK